MAVISGGHLQRFLQKFFGVKGELVAPETGPEIHPVIPIIGLPMEHRFLDGITTWVKEANVTGDATHPGIWFLQNPAGSNIQVKILQAQFFYTPAAVGSPLSWLIMSWDPGTYASGSAGFLLDSRARTRFAQRSVAKTSTLATAGGVGVNNLWPIAQPWSGTTLHVIGGCGAEILLNPTDALGVCTSQNTEAIKGQVIWTERFLDPSESTA